MEKMQQMQNLISGQNEKNCLGVHDCEAGYINGNTTTKIAKGSVTKAEMINAVEKAGFSAELKENIQFGTEHKIEGTKEM